VVLGVAGSIAAYKAADVASRLAKAGHDVHVVMTRAAKELVTPATFHPLTGNPVLSDLFDQGAAASEYRVEHVGLADRAEVFLLAPATANVLGKVAHGIADDFLTTLVLAYAGPVVVAPAMNDNMWLHPAVQQNVARLREFGYRFVDPEAGDLACGRSGVGRLAAPERVVAAVEAAGREARAAGRRPGDVRGAGPSGGAPAKGRGAGRAGRAGAAGRRHL
jgi:phosphopantothenoylcysteine decarboxylase/phosphopantothenate--cysteine ligase